MGPSKKEWETSTEVVEVVGLAFATGTRAAGTGEAQRLPEGFLCLPLAIRHLSKRAPQITPDGRPVGTKRLQVGVCRGEGPRRSRRRQGAGQIE